MRLKGGILYISGSCTKSYGLNYWSLRSRDKDTWYFIEGYVQLHVHGPQLIVVSLSGVVQLEAYKNRLNQTTVEGVSDDSHTQSTSVNCSP